MISTEKPCLACGGMAYKRKTESKARWAKRKYCSRKCGATPRLRPKVAGFRVCARCHENADHWRSASYCKECNKDLARDWRRRNPQKVSAALRRHAYGLADADYERMIEDQQGRCGICGDETKLVVDHCHSSGRVRELLCAPCNKGIGWLKEDPDTLIAALGYVRHYPQVSKGAQECLVRHLFWTPWSGQSVRSFRRLQPVLSLRGWMMSMTP